jgi:pimeloyl-ACP methyl ester carboxylesterase
MVRWLWLLLLIPTLPVLGMAYQWMGALMDRRRFIGLGRLVDVGDGRQVYVSDMGRGMESGPTVIFESGIAATSQNWLRVQQSVAGYARAVSYDRGGLGWSDACTSERTPANIARELHHLLELAGIPGPYVMVGHSFGGLIVRRYAVLYPGEVAGVVLVDPMRTEEWPPVNESQRPLLDRGIRMAGFGIPVARFGLARLATTSLLCRSGKASRAFSRAAGNGGIHVMQRITCEVGKMPREVWPIVAAHWASPKYYRGLAAHLQGVPATVTEMHGAEAMAGIPVVLLTPGTAKPLCNAKLGRIATQARQVIAERSGHWVHLDEPELVLETIRSMVEQVSRTEVPAKVPIFHAEALRGIESADDRSCATVVPIPVTSFSPSGTA